MNPRKIYIATAYWCEDHWVIAAGFNRDNVVAEAASYVELHPAKCRSHYTSRGNFKPPDSQGRAAEGYFIEEVDETP